MVHHTTDCVADANGRGGAWHFDAQAPLLDAEVRADRAEIDDFGRLVRLVRDNERLLAELDSVRAQSRRAWRYLSGPGSNAGLALAQLDRLRLRRSALLTHLRANRVEARAILGVTPPSDERIELN